MLCNFPLEIGEDKNKDGTNLVSEQDFPRIEIQIDAFEGESNSEGEE